MEDSSSSAAERQPLLGPLQPSFSASSSGSTIASFHPGPPSMFTSLKRRLAVSDDSEVNHGFRTTHLINPDIAPMPPSRRIWGRPQYLAFFAIAQFTITAWAASAAILGLGLAVWEAVVALFVSQVFVVTVASATGWVGGEWHVGFTVVQRIIFGQLGSYIGIAIRVTLSVVWYASQAWLGGLCVTAMISSWSRAFLEMPNTFPEDAHVATRDFVGFAVFQLISVPLMWFRPEVAIRPVAIANCVTFCVMLSITAWTCHTAGGVGPLIRAPGPPSPDRAWTWFYAITSGIGAISAGILNQADFTRFAKRQGDQVPGLAFATFVPGTMVPLMGILTASASLVVWDGQPPFWNPLYIVIQWMVDDYTAGRRAAAFFCSLGLVCSQLAENIMGNGYAAGMDLAGLFPRYINIRRGCMICAALSWVVQPWLFYNTSSVFVATMASFSVFLAPLTGIMVTDYFLLRKQKIELSQLYTLDKDGSYFFTHGFNLRAILVWILCFVPAVPGMVGRLNPNISVPDGLVKYNTGNYFFGFFSASLIYYVVVRIFPPKNLGCADPVDMYGTFTEEEARRKTIAPFEPADPNAEPAKLDEAADVPESSNRAAARDV
ncbi:thiamine transporter [Pyricularia oryzae 70-15]|uniref:Thiamine transporter n=3 Tax=Pyricularia oryzae TaxID=318829 RepID=G4N1Z9_PYRO7|nr:thiamine transporter [Pyricularia oryzae 70-15]EHA53309.1 thiamine transporter [Pyricularia oryzae 70-15]ELQ32427.1 thiamine transporter [Pyricularia oryzae Y34]KAI7912975.1 thiamine transporter [Pyricularia oryzae]KAI7913029.1 thiamine transporter [Pyricularia oryzae]